MIKVRVKSGKFYRHEEGVLKKYVKGDLVEFENVFNIPDGFRKSFDMSDHTVTLDDGPEEEPEGPPEPAFKIEHRGGGKYNVVSVATGEAINDELLTKVEAEALATTGPEEPPEEVEPSEPPEEDA